MFHLVPRPPPHLPVQLLIHLVCLEVSIGVMRIDWRLAVESEPGVGEVEVVGVVVVVEVE